MDATWHARAHQMSSALPCPAASLCAADPDACQSSLDGSSLALLIALNVTPLLSLVWLPFAHSAQLLSCGPMPDRKISDALGVSNGLLVVLASLAMGFFPTF